MGAAHFSVRSPQKNRALPGFALSLSSKGCRTLWCAILSRILLLEQLVLDQLLLNRAPGWIETEMLEVFIILWRGTLFTMFPRVQSELPSGILWLVPDATPS